jgi:hypothetical protein
MTNNDDAFALDAIRAALAELENKGIIERTGELRWSEVTSEWEPVYTHTELGRVLSAAGIDPSEYKERAS